MKKVFLVLAILILSYCTYAQTYNVPIIKSVIDKSSDSYDTSIEKYKANEFWGMWSVPLSNFVLASSTISSQMKVSYNIKNIQDYNLNTAWVFKLDSSTKSYFEYTIKFPKNTAYAGAYQFQGICNLFNGYCKSLKTWSENSRIKTLLVYYNDKPVCYVKLLDTWHFQSFDIAKFFKNKRDKKYLNSKYEIKNGDKLKFEIVDVYKGTKFTDVAVSEFLCEGGTN